MKFAVDIVSIKTGELYQRELVDDINLGDFFSVDSYFIQPYEGDEYITVVDEDFGIRGYLTPILDTTDIVRGLIETDILGLDIAEEEGE